MRLALLFDDPEIRTTLTNAQEDAGDRLDRLTIRQRQIANLLAEGHSNKVIAYRLDVAERSIEAHRAEIMRRTGVSSFASLVRLVVLAG